jgi:hypothetical protein
MMFAELSLIQKVHDICPLMMATLKYFATMLYFGVFYDKK